MLSFKDYYSKRTKELTIFQMNSAIYTVLIKQDTESAISDCTKAIELNPDYVKVYVRRAKLYEETDKLDEALEDYKKILTLDPGHIEANHATRVIKKTYFLHFQCFCDINALNVLTEITFTDSREE